MMGHSVRNAFAFFNEVRVFGDEWQNAVRLALVQTSGNAYILKSRISNCRRTSRRVRGLGG